MHTNNHGGGCCGVFHLMGCDTGRYTLTALRREVAKGNSRMMAELVATDGQLNNDPRLRSVLEEVGFTLVYRFQNPNSGNYCNVFLNSTAKDDLANTPKGCDLAEVEKKEKATPAAIRWQPIQTYWRARPHTSGLRCRINSPNSIYHREAGIILSYRDSKKCRTSLGTFAWSSIEIER